MLQKGLSWQSQGADDAVDQAVIGVQGQTPGNRRDVHRYRDRHQIDRPENRDTRHTLIDQFRQQERQSNLQRIHDQAENQGRFEGSPNHRILKYRDEVLQPDELPTAHLAQGIGVERFFKAEDDRNIAEDDQLDDGGRLEKRRRPSFQA